MCKSEKLCRLSAGLVISLLILAIAVTGGEIQAEETMKVAAITPYGTGVPFEEAAFAGLDEAAEDFALETTIIRAEDPGEYPVQLRAMAEEDYQVIIALHDYFYEDIEMVAEEYPEKKFILVDSHRDTERENLKIVEISPSSGSFLSGVAAAHATENEHVGFVGGLDHPIIIQFLAGLEAGINHVNPEIEISASFAGTFEDPGTGQELALNLMERGADVIMHAADYTGIGAMRAAAEADNYAIGADVDQADIAPGQVIASAIKDVGGAVYYSLEEIAAEEFQPGHFVFGPEYGADMVSIPEEIEFYQENPEVLSLIEELKTELEAGEIEVPLTTEMEY